MNSVYLEFEKVKLCFDLIVQYHYAEFVCSRLNRKPLSKHSFRVVFLFERFQSRETGSIDGGVCLVPECKVCIPIENLLRAQYHRNDDDLRWIIFRIATPCPQCPNLTSKFQSFNIETSIIIPRYNDYL